MFSSFKKKGGIIPFLFFLFFSFSSLLRADFGFIIGESTLLIDKTGMKINEISSELKEKSGVSIYVTALESIGSKDLKEFEAEIESKLNAPYVWLYIIKDIKKINIKNSSELDKKFDKKTVFWDYIMPIIPKNDKELTNERISAAMLNGYSQIVEDIAKAYKVELKSAITSQRSWFDLLLNYLFYGMVITVVVILAISYIKSKK